MSFILDALKKSENERQRYNGPSLVDSPVRRHQNERPWWAIGLAALLVLNLLVFAVVLFRGGGSEPVAHTTEAAPPPTTNVAPPPTPTPTAAPEAARSRPTPEPTSPAVHSLAAEAGVPESDDELLPDVSNPDLIAAAEPPPGPPIVRPIQGPATAPLEAQPGPPRNEVLPTINDLTASGRSQLPPLHLDIHVYSTTPRERFVFINMSKYREGDSTKEGATVERIDRDGVVMNHGGLRFVLPRQ